MVPIALQLSSFESFNDSKSSETQESQETQEKLTAAIAQHLDEIDSFLHDPHRFRGLVAESTFALSSLPVLLRYHSDSQRRTQTLLALTARSELEQDAERLAQQLILGDILSMAFDVSDADPLEGFAMGPHRLLSEAVIMKGVDVLDGVLDCGASDCDASGGLSALQHRCYQALWQSLENCILGKMTASNSVIEGIAIALCQPNSYPAVWQNAQQCSQSTLVDGGKPAHSSVARLSVDHFKVESAMVAGVVLGALSGRHSLPVLWQLQTCGDRIYSQRHYCQRLDSQSRLERSHEVQRWQLQQVIDLADHLFEDWAGISRKSHTIIPK
ncbi:MAG: hypothetical protein AAF716_16370 [Cyanobacteria bacterium P01_D01_bin.1]